MVHASATTSRESDDCPEKQVLVVGGGVDGLAVAAFLRARGFDPVVVEAADPGRRGSWGPSTGCPVPLWSDALDRLARVGLFGAVRRAGTVVRDVAVHAPETGRRDGDAGSDETGRRPGHGAATSPGVADGHATTVVSRAALWQVLRTAVPDERIRTGTAVESLTEERGGVTAEFADGVFETFDAVVGADGPSSTVRRLRFTERARVEFRGATEWTARLENAAGPDGPTAERLADGTVSIAWPHGDDWLWYLAVPADEPTGAPDPSGDGDLAAAGCPRPDDPAAGDRVRPDGPTGDGPPAVVRADDWAVDLDRWVDGRVALAGDAAHAVHPASGVGTALALADAEALAAALAEHPIERALARYDRRRREEVADRRRRVARVDDEPPTALAWVRAEVAAGL